MTESYKASSLQKIITTLIGGLLLGFLWRVRGSHGWGSEEGLILVGTIFTLFLLLVFGERKKLDLGWFSLTVISFVLTVPSWGTILTQITGVLREGEIEEAFGIIKYVSVPSALVLMFSIGFGMAGLYSIFLGRGFSEKQWKIKDFIILFASFLLADLITKASLSHFIVNLIQPEAVNLFNEGLKEVGIERSAYSVYLEHFADISWGKKIIGGRNYFSEIQAISSMFRALAAILAVRFLIKDKVAAKISTVICLSFGFSITISDLFFYFSKGGYHENGASPFPENLYAWSCWEYFTGFLAGVIITAFLYSIKTDKTIEETTFNFVPLKLRKALIFVAGFASTVALNIVNPLKERFDTNETFEIIALVVGLVLALLFIFLLVKKFGFNAEKGMYKLSNFLFPILLTFTFVVYMFICSREYMNIFELNMIHNILCVVSFALVFIWYLIKRKKEKGQA